LLQNQTSSQLGYKGKKSSSPDKKLIAQLFIKKKSHSTVEDARGLWGQDNFEKLNLSEIFPSTNSNTYKYIVAFHRPSVVIVPKHYSFKQKKYCYSSTLIYNHVKFT
jgi:hypothetical protein